MQKKFKYIGLISIGLGQLLCITYFCNRLASGEIISTLLSKSFLVSNIKFIIFTLLLLFIGIFNVINKNNIKRLNLFNVIFFGLNTIYYLYLGFNYFIINPNHQYISLSLVLLLINISCITIFSLTIFIYSIKSFIKFLRK